MSGKGGKKEVDYSPGRPPVGFLKDKGDLPPRHDALPDMVDLLKMPLVRFRPPFSRGQPVGHWPVAGRFGHGLSQRPVQMLVTVYRGPDGVDRVAFHTDSASDSEHGDHPLFSDSMASAAWARHPAFTAAAERIDVYAAETLSKYGLPYPGDGLIWDDAAGRLRWCRNDKKDDPIPPDYVRDNPAGFAFEGLADEVAAKFVKEYPGGDEAVYASQWLKVRDAIIHGEGIHDFKGRSAKNWGEDHDPTDADEALWDGFYSGLAVGERLGAILYEWRLCVLYGADLSKKLEVKEARGEAQEATTKYLTAWHPFAFDAAQSYWNKYPDSKLDAMCSHVYALLEKEKARLDPGFPVTRVKAREQDGDVMAQASGPGRRKSVWPAAKPNWPALPGDDRVLRLLSTWKNKGFVRSEGAEPEFLRPGPTS